MSNFTPSLHLSPAVGKFQKFIVKHIYADHNKSKSVAKILTQLLRQNESGVMLNIGAGDTRIHPKIINLDLNESPNVDIVASASCMPFSDCSVDLVVSQEVLEHVPDPSAVLEEIYRVLRPSGCLYLQLPWIIGYHGCPRDFWRFSRDGILQIAANAGFCVQESGVTVGPFTGFYRVAVEAFAIFGSLFSSRLYKPFKLVAAILLLPIKVLDQISLNSQESHRLAGGFFIVAIKEN